MPQLEGAGLPKLSLRQTKLDKRAKKKLVRRGIMFGNVLLLMLVATFVVYNRSASQTVRASTLSSATSTASDKTDPLDQLSSSQIALTAAQMTNMPELPAIKNTADSDTLLLSVVPNDSTALSKPQIVATAEKSRADIVHYTVKSCDTVTSLSKQFHVSAGDIRWSNNINGDTLTAGLHLVIPPINGIVYKVKSGDTPAGLAAKYSADKTQIIEFNDAEVSGIRPGELIVIPNGQVVPVVVAAVYSPALTYGSFTATYGGNGYDYGYCTWYVANRVAVPTNWGNANTWDDYGRLSGWTVSTVPVVGAIAQTDRGFEGHVAYVEAVSPDHSQIKYSDMNGLAGWGRVGYSGWTSSTYFEHYIYK